MNDPAVDPDPRDPIFPELEFDDSVEGRLFQAGWDVLMSGDGTLFESGLNPERIAESAGVSRRTFYRYFSDKATYIDALMVAILKMTFTSQPIDSLGEIIESTGGLRAVVSAVAQKYWEELCESNLILTRVVLLTLAGNSSELYEIARDAHEKAIQTQEPILAAITRAWGLEPRPPWTHRTILVLIGSLFDGFMVRGVYRSETTEIGDMTGAISAAIIPILFRSTTEVEDDFRRYQDDFFSRLQEHIESLGNPVPVDRTEDIDAALLQALASRGLEEISISSLAVDARTTKERVAVMGTVAEQVCSQARRSFDSAAEELNFDVGLGTFDDDEILERLRARVALVARDNAQVMRAFLQLRVSNRNSVATSDSFQAIEDAYDNFVQRTGRSDLPRCRSLIERELSQVLLEWGSESS